MGIEIIAEEKIVAALPLGFLKNPKGGDLTLASFLIVYESGKTSVHEVGKGQLKQLEASVFQEFKKDAADVPKL